MASCQEESGRIIFYFNEDDSIPTAIGTLNGDLLELRYSEMMQHSDFEDAVYRR